MSYLVLGDTEQCSYRLNQASFDKKPNGQLIGYNEMIRGILEEDERLIYKGIEKQLKWFNGDRESRDSIGFPYNFPVMGFVNFARHKGMEISLDSPQIYPDMRKPLPFIFEGIPEVYAAIEKAKRKQQGFLGKLKKFLHFASVSL